MAAKVVQPIFIRIAVAKGKETGEAIQIPRARVIDSLVQAFGFDRNDQR